MENYTKLKKHLLEKLEMMKESKYSFEKEHEYQLNVLFSAAAGYAPDAPVKVVFDIIQEIL